MTLNCCIIDDEPLALNLLERNVVKTPFINLKGKYLGALQAMDELLPSSLFMRLHHSFIVQIEKIKIIDLNRIVFGKAYIPISDSYKKEFAAYFSSRSINNSI